MIWEQFTHLGNFPPELKARFNSFLTTEFDDSLSVEMQLRSIIKWCQDNFKTVDTLIDFINGISNWLKQFENNFDTKLEDSVISVLSEWQESGYLDIVISEALQWELDNFKEITEQNFLSVNQQLEQLNKGVDNFTTLKNYADNYFLGLSKSVPDYYVYRLREIANIVNSEDDNVLRAIFLTDNHNQYTEYAHNSIYHMEYGAMLTNLCDIDLYVLGGDNANGWYTKPEITNELKSSVSVAYNLSNINTDVFALNGNHDNGAFQNGKNKLNDIITNDELKHIMRTKHSVFNETREKDSLYFFKDYPSKKYRIFGLDNFNFPNETVGDELKWNNLTHSAYSEEQLRWFAKHLKETPEDYHVIIFQHAPLLNVFNDQTQYNGDVLKDILKAFKSGSSFSISDNTRPIPVNLSIDFEGRNGVIAVVVNGHLHEDLSTVWEGILCVSTEASLCYPQTETRKWDTYSEDSWDCMLFDYDTRTIQCLRFGYGENRLFSY